MGLVTKSFAPSARASCLAFRELSRGENQHRNEGSLWHSRAELLEQRESVDVRHPQIDRHQIRLEFGEGGKRRPRIRDAPQVLVACLLQHAFQKENVFRPVVDDEDPAILDDVFPHRSGRG